MTPTDCRSWCLCALIVCGGFGLGPAATAQDRLPAEPPGVRGDSLLVATAPQAIAIAIGYLQGAPAAADAADGLLSGASARDTGAYWIVSVTRVGLVILDRPRLIAVEKATGRARDVFTRAPHKDHDEGAARPHVPPNYDY